MKAAVRAFAKIAARTRALVWPITVKLEDETEVEIAKSASKVDRTPAEQGVGYVARTVATFNFPTDGEFVPVVGNEWTITESELDDELGTIWRCFDLIRSAGGSEHRCVCFKLD